MELGSQDFAKNKFWKIVNRQNVIRVGGAVRSKGLVLNQIYNVEWEGYVGAALAAPTVKLSADKTRLTEY